MADPVDPIAEMMKALGADSAPAEKPKFDSTSALSVADSIDAGIAAGTMKPTASLMAQATKAREADALVRNQSASAYQASKSVLDQIDVLTSKNDDLIGQLFGGTKGDTAFGTSGRIPEFISGFVSSSRQAATGALALIAGNEFLNAYESLKGGGSISNAENEAAKAARTVLLSQTNDEESRKALAVLKDLNEKIRERNDPNKPMRVLPDGTVVPLSEFLQRTSTGSGTTDIVTGQPAAPAQDLTGQKMTNAQIKALWDSLPSGATITLNGDTRTKP